MPAEPELHRIRCDTRRPGSRAIFRGKAIAMMRMPLIKRRKIELSSLYDSKLRNRHAGRSKRTTDGG